MNISPLISKYIREVILVLIGLVGIGVLINGPGINPDARTEAPEQDFSRGVLVVNINKSMYLPGDQAYIQMGMVDAKGKTVCDAQLELRIKNRDTQKGAILSTDRGTILHGENCGDNSLSSRPDYFGYVNLPEEPGMYEMELTSSTEIGVIVITERFEIRETVPFDVERFAPTRIYPPAIYETKFHIIPTEDFKGSVIESLPASFEISNLKAASTRIQDGRTEIIWNVDWKAGQTYELMYGFKVPPVSPYKYLLGPLRFELSETGFTQTGDTTLQETAPVFKNAFDFIQSIIKPQPR